MVSKRATTASTAKATTTAATKKAPTKSGTTKVTKATATVKKPATAAKPRVRKPVESEPEATEDDVESSTDEINGVAEEQEEENEEQEPTKPAPKKKVAAPKKTAASKTSVAPTKKAAPKTKKGTEERAREIIEVVKTVKPGARKPKAAQEINGDDASEVQTRQEKLEQSKPKPKRKTHDDGEERPVKRVRTAPVPVAGRAINETPEDILDIFVFGEGTSGELGLGSRKYDGAKKPIDVKRPRINHNLAANKVGVVQMSCGGMHVVALTHDDKILTWGVNDDRALGRDTTWNGGVRDVDDEDSDSDDDDDTGMNPVESTPGEVDFTDIKLEGTKFVQVAATDSASFVLTSDGRVYGWGTFRGAEGIIGFADQVRTQQVPIMIDGLKDIKRLAAGANHVLALDADGKVFAWGSGGQYQLGRKAITRGKNSGLKPEPCGKFNRKRYAVDIAAGSYHSFYIDNHGQVWAWGLNNYSQTGHSDDTGQDDAMVLVPKPVDALSGKTIVSIDGGVHHSVAATDDGELLTWGRVDGHQVGHPKEVYNEDNAIFDDNGRPRILVEPTAIKGKYKTERSTTSRDSLLIQRIDIKATFVASGTDNNFALNEAGQVYSWGFSANYQTGQGTTDDIEAPTLIDNTAIRGLKIVWAGAGGQYSMLAASSNEQPPAVNGHAGDSDNAADKA